MSDVDIAALEAEIDAEEKDHGGKRRQPPAPSHRRPPPPPPPLPPASSSVPPHDGGMDDDHFDDPYDAIDFKAIAALTAQSHVEGSGAEGGDDEDESGAGLQPPSDDSVDEDMRDLMREIEQEGREGTDAEEDEDEELARLEKEEESEQKQPLPLPRPAASTPPPYPSASPSPDRVKAEQEAQRRLLPETIRPALPTTPPPALNSETAVASLRSSLEACRRRALDFHRAGKTKEALEVMKNVKTLQARIQQMEAGQSFPAPPLPSSSPCPPSPSSSSSPRAVEGVEALSVVKVRLLEYQRAAVFHKQAGRLDRAKQLLVDIRKMKTAIEAAQADGGGRGITAVDVPPPLDPTSQTPRLVRQGSGSSKGGGAAAASVASALSLPPRPPTRPTQTSPSPSTASATSASPSPPPVPGRRPASGLTTKQSLQYDNLIQALTSQANDLRHQTNQLLSAASAAASSPSPPSSSSSTERTYKLLALQYHRLLKRTQSDLDLVRTAAQRGIPPPSYHNVEERLTAIHENADIRDDQLVLLLHSSRELTEAVHFITLQWEGAGQTLSYSSGSMKGPTVEWKGRWVVSIGKRSKQVERAVQRSRVVLVLYRHRLIMGNVEVGRGEMRLKDLTGKCDKREVMKLKDPEGKKVGEATVEVRLRRPLERMEVRENTRELLVIDEFEQGPMSPAVAAAPHQAAEASPLSAASSPSSSSSSPPHSKSPSATASHPASSAASASTGPSSTPSSAGPSATSHPPLPAGLTDEDVSDPHSILSIFSNDVLEWEINTRIPALLSLARQRNDAPAVEDCMDRLTSAQTQLQILVTAVQAGKLGLEEYLGKLREGIAKGELLAKELMRRGRKDDAKVVIQRVQLMRQEVKTAEENAGELE